MTHIHTQKGEFDFTITGYLVHNDKVLLIKHKKLPFWTGPGSHVELNESPIDALYKEISEESGIDASHLTLIETHSETNNFARGEESTRLPVPFDMEYHYINDDHRHINMIYLLASDTDDVRPDDGESQTFKWFSVDELRSFTDARPQIIECATYALSYIKEHRS